MNCQSFEEIVNELGRGRTLDQTMESNLPEGALVHLDECTACALRLQDGRALTLRLDELAQGMSSLTAPESVEEALRRAFRDRIAAPALSPVLTVADRNQSRWNRWNFSLVAVAVVLLIVLGTAGLRLWAARYSQPARVDDPVARSSPKESPSTRESETTNLPPKIKKEVPDTGRPKRPDLRARHSFNRKGSLSSQTVAKASTPTASDTQSEVATQFMPLGYAGPINLQDGAQLVRIEMSRSAMLSLGLPVNMDRYSESVKADVLLGADGFARAIRFVQ
jgi:hypothetical protein